MSDYKRGDGSPLVLGPPLSSAQGGEGQIHSVQGQSRAVVKMLSKPTSEHEEKVIAMAGNAPDDPGAGLGHTSFAWPFGPIYGPSGYVGFEMPYIDRSRNVLLALLFASGDRRATCPEFTWALLLRTARNLARVVWEWHRKGYVLADVLNESNILVSIAALQAALVTLVDCASAQVAANGQVYRCPVGKADYTPPELQPGPGDIVRFEQIDRTVEHDYFALAVLIFLILMEGGHPYACYDPNDPDERQIPIEEAIRAGYCPFVPWTGPGAVSIAPFEGRLPFEVLPLGVQLLVLECFGYSRGHRDPSLRPSAERWYDVLEDAERHLKVCALNPQHVYADHLPCCPWCERMQRTGVSDPFPLPGQQQAATPVLVKSAYAPARPTPILPTTHQPVRYQPAVPATNFQQVVPYVSRYPSPINTPAGMQPQTGTPPYHLPHTPPLPHHSPQQMLPPYGYQHSPSHHRLSPFVILLLFLLCAPLCTIVLAVVEALLHALSHVH